MRIVVYYRCGLAAMFWFPENILMVDIGRAISVHGQVRRMEFK